jgi:Flp pilus assembly protein TadD
MFDFTKDRAWADRAISASETARRLDPSLAEVDVTLGGVLFRTGRANEAVEAFQRALTAQPGSYEALSGLGRALGDAGRDREAEAAFRRAMELRPSSFAAYSQLGGLYFDRGRFREAAAMFRRVTELAPNGYSGFSNLGGVLTMACDFPAAIEAYRKALALRPEHPAAASNLGMTQLWTGHYGEAVSSLETASRAAPNDYRIWGNLGDAYHAARAPKGRADEAFTRSITLARAQLRLNPKDAAAKSYLATSLAKTGHIAEAAAPMREALALEEKNPNILSDAAIVAALSGRTDEALSLLRKAVDAGYCPAIIAHQPEFETLRNRREFREVIERTTRGPA